MLRSDITLLVNRLCRAYNKLQLSGRELENYENILSSLPDVDCDSLFNSLVNERTQFPSPAVVRQFAMRMARADEPATFDAVVEWEKIRDQVFHELARAAGTNKLSEHDIYPVTLVRWQAKFGDHAVPPASATQHLG